MPDFVISLLSFSFLPFGTSECGIFGMLDKIFSKSNLVLFCCSLISSIESEISFDLVNKDLSFDFEISFFSFSSVSFF